MNRIIPTGLHTSLRTRGLYLFVVVFLATSCATTGGLGRKGKEPDLLAGTVQGPGGRSIPFAKISVIPTGPDMEGADSRRVGRRSEPVELPAGARGLAVTTEGGRWTVDHLSSDEGEDLGLPGNYYYEVTVYKLGFHVWKDSVLYERGTLDLEVTLYPDTIDIEDVGNMVDTDYGDTNTGTGVTRQGE